MKDQLHSRFIGRAALCGDKPITCMGMTFTPDDDRAYVEFTLSHCLPVTTFQGGALHPGTVFNSFGSLLHKNFNLGHNLKAYNKDTEDMALGSVLAIEWEGEDRPASGFEIPKSRAAAPGIRGVAVIHRNWQYADEAMGMKVKTVSMEVTYNLETSAFAIAGDNGWEFIAYAQADDALKACWSKPKSGVGNWSMTGTYNGKKPVLLFNGVDGTVRYLGLAIVSRGYENEATIERVLSGEMDPDADTDADPWKRLAAVMVEFLKT